MLLRSVREQARNNGATLYDGLLAGGIAQITTTTTGSGLIARASANGHSYEFNIAPAGTPLNPEHITATFGELLDCYDRVLAQRQSDGDATDDDSMLTAMLAADELQRVERSCADYTLLRWPGRY